MAFLVTAVLALPATFDALRHGGTSTMTFESFRQEMGIERGDDSLGYDIRKAFFERRKREVMQHNSRPGRLWTAAVNKFADFSEAEFQALLGHRPGVRRTGATSVSMLDLQPANIDNLATAVDWSARVNTTFSQAKDQGGCGSCWAVASAGALETAADLIGEGVEVSYEEMVDCVPNLRQCGGSGGCKGATAELAFDWLQKAGGVSAKSDYKGYQNGGDGSCRSPSKKVLSITGFQQLEVNKMRPLMEAVSQGPVVVSADASPWGMYSKGVFDGCSQDAIINHAILMLGYGTDQGLNKPYWLIRNSWGKSWGENGFIRLLRHEAEDSYCGTDDKPLEGVGCVGGPATLPVCGMCGVLSDSSYPVGVHRKDM